jgi:hypothetical protein
VVVAFWIVFAFLLGLAAGAGATWWLLGRPPVRSPQAGPLPPSLELAEEVADSMSLTAQRLLRDLERKYEGAVADDDEGAAKPRRPPAKRPRRPARDDPADPDYPLLPGVAWSQQRA